MSQAGPGLKTLMACFLRTYMVGAAFNTRGMQNVGLVFAMEPGLRRIYPDPAERQKARKRYLRHYNTHMFWTPVLVGIFLSLEDKIAKGLFPAKVLDSVKNTTIYTLSAIGDSVFGGSLLVFWSLSTAALLVADLKILALCLGCLWILSLQAFKFVTFVVGYKEGLKFLLRLKKWDLINWGRRLKYLNAVLMVIFLLLVWPQNVDLRFYPVAVAAFSAIGWMVMRLSLPREIPLFVLLVAYLCLAWFDKVKTQLF